MMTWLSNIGDLVFDIWTIGHSTRSIEEFTELLTLNNITTLVDVRSFPGSRKYPQFNKEELAKSLEQEGINYLHIVNLGGRRKPNKFSPNTTWRHPSFRAYADYMESEKFVGAATQLERLGESRNLAYMCSECLWWRCHRSMLSDFLMSRGWSIGHILSKGEVKPHKYTEPARISQGVLTYRPITLFSPQEG